MAKGWDSLGRRIVQSSEFLNSFSKLTKGSIFISPLHTFFLKLVFVFIGFIYAWGTLWKLFQDFVVLVVSGIELRAPHFLVKNSTTEADIRLAH